jgi:hypothetical protein
VSWLWVIIALAILILLILLVLCIPVNLVFSATINESPRYNIRLLWLFGLVDHKLKKPASKPPGKRGEARDGQKQKRKISATAIYRMLKTRGLFHRTWRLVRGIFKSFHITELAAHLKLGLEDPADTAFLFALAGPANYFLNMLPYDIRFSPVFEGDLCFEFYLQGIIRLLPILIVVAVLQFVFSRPAIRIAKIMAVTGWKKA